MNSVAIVEQPDGRVYLVAVMSDAPYKNSAVEHQSLATFIDRILKLTINPEPSNSCQVTESSQQSAGGRPDFRVGNGHQFGNQTGISAIPELRHQVDAWT